MTTETTRHTPKGKTCGCCLEPVDDAREQSDLCSEASGSNDGRGWVIAYCPTHAAAQEMAELLRAYVEHNDTASWPGYSTAAESKCYEDKGKLFDRAAALLRRIDGGKDG